MKRISVIGSGWLGYELVKLFKKKQFEVKASFRSQKTKEKLRKAGFQSLLVNDSFIDEQIFDCNILVINIPPGVRKDSGVNHLAFLKALKKSIKRGTRVIYCNSTAIYGEGCELTEVDTTPESVFLEFENVLRPLQATILRLGGLVGHDRRIIDTILKKGVHPKVLQPVNFVHRDDVVDIVLEIVNREVFGEVFNVVAPFHPLKGELYTLWAKQLSLTIPIFDNSKGSSKTISSKKIQRALNYKFKYPDPLKFWEL